MTRTVLGLSFVLALSHSAAAGYINPNPVLNFDYTGTFSTSYDGISQFSGSILYVDTSDNPSGTSYGNDTNDQVWMTLTIGSHTITIGD